MEILQLTELQITLFKALGGMIIVASIIGLTIHLTDKLLDRL